MASMDGFEGLSISQMFCVEIVHNTGTKKKRLGSSTDELNKEQVAAYIPVDPFAHDALIPLKKLYATTPLQELLHSIASTPSTAEGAVSSDLLLDSSLK